MALDLKLNQILVIVDIVYRLALFICSSSVDALYWTVILVPCFALFFIFVLFVIGSLPTISLLVCLSTNSVVAKPCCFVIAFRLVQKLDMHLV